MEANCVHEGCKKKAGYVTIWDTGGGSYWCHRHVVKLLKDNERPLRKGYASEGRVMVVVRLNSLGSRKVVID